MQRRYNLTHFLLAIVAVLNLTPLMVVVDAQAQIAFVSHRDGNPEIYVMDADGDNQRRLTNHPDGDWMPSWSPDGKRIAFVSQRDGVSEIYVMDADGGKPQNLTNNPSDDNSPSWSPDGKRIAFSSNRDNRKWRFIFEIYIMDADGGNQQNLTNNPLDDQSPSWSPDGKRIVFSARRPGHFENKFAITHEIYVMDADGGNEQRLTENRVDDGAPSWSPDSERIAFAADEKGDFENYEIYIMDADGGNLQNLTNNPNHDVNPAWSNSPFSVSPAGKKFTMWGRLKQVDR